MPATPAWLAAVESLLNRGIHGSAPATMLARSLESTSLHVDIEGMNSIRVGVAGGRLSLVTAAGSDVAPAGEADATIKGTLLGLLRLGLGRDGGRGAAAAAPAAARIEVRGDAEIANGYHRLLAAARPDVEEEMSRLIGDPSARLLSRFAQRTMAWARSVQRTAGQNIAEYLTEESRDLVSEPELEEFAQGVDALRETADRVEARIARLELRGKDRA